MSFGFGVGDFIAVGELCWKLYSQVYEVSRGAPEAIQNLKTELGDMHLTINKLVEDTKDPNSILVQCGLDRINLACNVLEKTQETLKKLDDLSGKYELLQRPSSHMAKRQFWKRHYDKVKFAAESRTINDLRAKLVFHNGQISLLLQMVQNSSLERIEDMQKKTENALQDIKAALSGATSENHTPLISGFDGPDQLNMTRKLMEGAEVGGRPWTSIGIRDWLQAGKWWLLKAQSQIYSEPPSTSNYLQAWADFIKASWILTDIVAVHPQRTFFGSGLQEMDILDIVQAIKTQQEHLMKRSAPRPALCDLETSSWDIWISKSATALLPCQGDTGLDSRRWETHGGFILFQRFALLRTSADVNECIVFLEVRDQEHFTLITQSFEGRDLYRCPVSRYYIWSMELPRAYRTYTMDLESGNRLRFFGRDDFLTAYLLTCGVKLCTEHYAGSQFDEALIYTMALLDVLSTPAKAFTAEVRVIRPRLKGLLGNYSGHQRLEVLWNFMEPLIPRIQAKVRGEYWRKEQKNATRHGEFILEFSESLEQCNTIFKHFPTLAEDDGVRNVIESAARVCTNTHSGETLDSIGLHDCHATIQTDWLRKFFHWARYNKTLTHEVLDAVRHMQASSGISSREIFKQAVEATNFDAALCLITENGKIWDTVRSEVWNLHLALLFIDQYGGTFAWLDLRPSLLDVVKVQPYLTTFIVIAHGLGNAAPRLNSRGLLDPNLATLVDSDGVDVLSGLDRLGIPHWPLRLALNMCSHPEVIRSLCQAGAHLGGDDEVLYSDLEVYKALLSRSNSQAKEIYSDTIASLRAVENHPESPTNGSMVPEAFISPDGQRIPLGRYWRIHSYVYDEPFAYERLNFEQDWKQTVLTILRETQEQRNLHAWLQLNGTITDALS